MERSSTSQDNKSRTRSKSPGRRKSSERNEITQEQLLLALRKKQECNARAQSIVEKFLNTKIQADELLESLKFINQSHFDDIIQERAIEKLCGWTLCENALTEVPQQQYKINCATKKVFDITERKLFCSGKCYKSAIYLKEQLLTSPLWLRDKEEIPEFKLLYLEN